MKRFLDYNKNLKERTKELSKNMTKPEKKLRFDFFKKLGNNPPVLTDIPLNKGDFQKQTTINNGDFQNQVPLNNVESQNQVPLIKGGRGDFLDFRIYKQKQINNFIVDFYIPKLKLVIEIDGESHFDEQGKAYDIERTQILEGLGLTIIRYTNEEVMNNFDGVCRNLEKEIKLN